MRSVVFGSMMLLSAAVPGFSAGPSTPVNLAQCRDMLDHVWIYVQKKHLLSEMSLKLHDLSRELAEDCRAGRDGSPLFQVGNFRSSLPATR